MIMAEGEDSGTFSTIKDPIKLISCNEGKDNAVGHSNADDKDAVSVSWKAPKGFKGKVNVFTFNFVKSNFVFINYEGVFCGNCCRAEQRRNLQVLAKYQVK